MIIFAGNICNLKKAEPEMLKHSFRHIIPPDQIDEVGNWHSPFYLETVLLARVDSFTALGITKDAILSRKLAIVAASVELNFRSPLKSEDVALIEICLEGVGSSSMRFLFEIKNEKTGEIAALGKLTSVFINQQTKKSALIPEDIRSKIEG